MVVLHLDLLLDLTQPRTINYNTVVQTIVEAPCVMDRVRALCPASHKGSHASSIPQLTEYQVIGVDFIVVILLQQIFDHNSHR
jgi:hypothetical protein